MEDHIVGGLLKLYEEHEQGMRKANVYKGTSCERGCTHCCYLFVAVSFVEGLAIAREVAGRPDWKWMLRRLRKAAKVFKQDITHNAYFRRKLPCPFLDEAKGDCMIYAVRPASCRYHLVVNDPVLCSPDNESDTMALDLRQCEAAVWSYSEQWKPPNLPAAPAGPMALLVLFLVGKYVNSADKLKFIKQQQSGLPNPYEWMSMVDMGRLAEEASPARALSHEEAEAELGKSF